MSWQPYYGSDAVILGEPGPQQYGLTTTVPPAAEPVEIDELEHQLRAVVPADDPVRPQWEAQLLRVIKAAREWCEEETGRRLVTQTVRATYHAFPCGPIRLPVAPVQSVTSLQYKDANGTTQTLTTHVPLLDAPAPLLYPPEEAGWPATRWNRPDAVTVTFVAGYGGASAVPERFKQAILLIACHNEENPGDSPRDGVEVPPAAKALLASLSARPYL